jgi:hypothetical protein
MIISAQSNVFCSFDFVKRFWTNDVVSDYHHVNQVPVIVNTNLYLPCCVNMVGVHPMKRINWMAIHSHRSRLLESTVGGLLWRPGLTGVSIGGLSGHLCRARLCGNWNPELNEHEWKDVTMNAYAILKNGHLAIFESNEEFLRYYQSLEPSMAPSEIRCEDGKTISFREYSFGRNRLCSMIEIGSDMLDDWAKSGIRLMAEGKRQSRSSDVARLCAIRDMLALDIPLLHAANIAGNVSNSILYHALRRSASLTRVITESETGMFRTVASSLGTDEAILRHALVEPIGKFAVIKHANLAVKLKRRISDDDHVRGAILDLDAAGKRLAERAASFLVQMVVRLPKRRDSESHDLASMIAFPTLQ